MLVTPMLSEAGAVRLTGPEIVPAAGAVRLTAGAWVSVEPIRYTEAAEFDHDWPADHVAGSVARFAWLLFCDALPAALSRMYRVPVPVGLSSAIQYFCAATIDTPLNGTWFHAPALRGVRLACPSKAPGVLEAVLV